MGPRISIWLWSVDLHPVPEGVVPLNATAHIVKNNESFETLAQRYGVSMDNIIYFNFKTHVPEEVNWYLNHYVGCKKTTRDGKNYMFSSGSKRGKRKGIIYIPPQNFTFPPVTIEGKLPPRFFTVREDPQTWAPPEMADNGATARIIVTLAPWTHENLTIGASSSRRANNGAEASRNGARRSSTIIGSEIL